MPMPVAEPAADEHNSHAREYVRHPWLAFIRPSVLAVIATLVSLGIAQEWPPGTQFLLLRCIDLLVLVMYFWQFARHRPSFLEASGIFLISVGFFFLISKAAFMAATVIILMAIAWFVMTWVAKRWPLLRGLTTLAVFIVVLKSALVLLRVMKAGDSDGIIHHGLGLLFLCMLIFIAFASCRTWHEERLFIPPSQIQSVRLWSSLLFLAVFAQTVTGASIHSLPNLHPYGGIVMAVLTIIVAWKVRLWLGRIPGLRWIPPALMIMPVNQVFLGSYVLLTGKSFWITYLHVHNGYGILVLSFLITASIWARSLGIGLPARLSHD
jgi:hypothetical protein